MSASAAMLPEIWRALGGEDDLRPHVVETGDGGLPCAFAVTDFAAATMGAAALALAEFVRQQTGRLPPVTVDRRLASFWFGKSLRPLGWSLPDQWDPIAGNYAAIDGWVRLHTNAPHHRAAALAQPRLQGIQVTGLAGTVDAFQRDEKTCSHVSGARPPEATDTPPRGAADLAKRGSVGASSFQRPRMYLFTARLCASRFSLNSLLPSPRDTKYSALVRAG